MDMEDHIEKVIMWGASEKTDSRDISGERDFSGKERQQDLVQEESEQEEKLEEDDTGETEYDVENVLAKQNTYDLFCPNCTSLGKKLGASVRGIGVQTSLAGTQVTETGQARELEIIKSIVYGGLIESITSLGIVSSAAGGGASTVNTLALALANLFGGLLLIANNLRELKNQQPGTTAAGETEDQYTELLGNRRHIFLHASIVILSFIVFGAVAPVTYAFSFRKSDSRDYKLAAVAGASVFCILLLAIGKAYLKTTLFSRDYKIKRGEWIA
ncbi:hypothetical protein MLD38_009050 [Melastoma candidum]|uniref:Uncharacterized protein n=1 Tax=Melastoma candidum TaxID=119954 RepID=A0ACB9RZD0_9MYRT|nr:hypothetical protein MLD38_009050 [Melastoma candidum]